MSMDSVIFREPEQADAQAIVAFYNRVGGETTFLSFAENEYPLDIKGQEESIVKIKKQNNEIMLLATLADKIICIGTISGTSKIKQRHCGTLGIVVSKECQGRGIGREMICRLLDYCRKNGITTKVQLETRTDNEGAVALYKKLGFEIEGELKNVTLIDGCYYHTYIMGLML